VKKLLLVAGLLFVAGTAQAFILSAGVVVRKMAAHRDELQLLTLSVRGALHLSGQAAGSAAQALGMPPSSAVAVDAVASYKLPGRCRIELSAPVGKARPAVANVNGSLRAEGPDLEPLRLFAAYACPLLYQRGGGETDRGLFGFLKDQGVDSAVVSLGRTGGAVAYVIGGNPKDAPTAWIEKEHFWPVRFVAKEGASILDVRLLDYASPISGEWHPRVVELRKDGELVGKLVLEKAEANPKLPDALF
jgi:hypothetical protein